MLGLLVLLAVAATVGLLGQALVPRGMAGGTGWTILAGTLGAAQAAIVVLLLFNLVGHVVLKARALKPVGPLPGTLTAVVKRAHRTGPRA